jgi:integrase
MKLDTRTVARLALPAGKNDHIEWDDDLSGFGFRLRASGDRVLGSWICQYRVHGRQRRILIGAAKVLSAEQARVQAKKILAKVALGEDPQADRQGLRAKEAHSLRSVIDEYLVVKQPSLRPASFRVTTLYLTGKAYFGPLHSTPISQITRADIAVRLLAIARNSGTVTAGRARSALSTLFRWAMGQGLCEANAVIGTNKPPDAQPRERVLSDAEIAAIWAASGDGEYGKIIKLLLILAARRAEIGGMCWSEIDLEKGTWSLPKERAKNKRALTLPLPGLAISIIESVPERVSRDQLFGERAAAGFTVWVEAKQQLDARLGNKVRPWTLHDLRRSAATRMCDLGVAPWVVEQILNHQSGHRAGIVGVYNLSSYDPQVRSAVGLWSAHIQSLVEGGGRKVISLHGKARR